MTVMLILATGMNFFSYWFSDSIVLRMYHCQPVGPEHRLYHIVEDLAQRAELPMPKVYIMPTEVPNAFATGAIRPMRPSRRRKVFSTCWMTKKYAVSWLMKCPISCTGIFS